MRLSIFLRYPVRNFYSITQTHAHNYITCPLKHALSLIVQFSQASERCKYQIQGGNMPNNTEDGSPVAQSWKEGYPTHHYTHTHGMGVIQSKLSRKYTILLLLMLYFVVYLPHCP